VYNDLYKAWKSEKTSEKPQPLASDFYQRMAGYLKGLDDDSTSSDERTVQGRLLVKEKEMAKRLLEELREARLQKIVSAARNGSPISTAELTEEEKTLVRNFNESLASFKTEEKKDPQGPPSERPVELSVVRFLQDIPEIVGVDLKIYGPYNKEDVGSLPSQNAQALVKQGVARMIEVKGISNQSVEK
jgi:DNA replication initiation complex subunit (GINS family)